jgi:hypothetical protein
MEIVNVIVVNKVIISGVRSYHIVDDSTKNYVVRRAEEDFIGECLKIGSSLEVHEWDDLLSAGSFDNQNGREVVIVWPDIADT